MSALHARRELCNHVVAQIVKAKLIICSIGDRCGIGLAARDRAELCGALIVAAVLSVEDERAVVRNHANREAERSEERPHPLRVAAGEIVVHGDHVDAATGQSIERRSKGPDKCLPFARLHLRDLSLMECNRTEDLLVIWAHAKRSARGLARGGECFGRSLVECRG